MADFSFPKDPYVVAQCFVPEQLTRARELNALTKTALAKKIDKTASAITQFESGVIQPDPKTLSRLSLALYVPVSFFARKPLGPRLTIDDAHFRSLRSVSQQSRRQALRIGELAYEIMSVLEEREGIELPHEKISQLKQSIFSTRDIESLATAVRRSWGLGDGPIPGLMSLLESKGINILPLANDCEGVDAFSFWYQNRPFIMLTMGKNASRAHFDAAHELGHLLMHEDALPADPDTEKQADQFASAFLLPKETFLAECPNRWSLDKFKALKKRWHVSIRAMVYRAHKLGRLSSASYRRAFTDLNRLYGKNEPNEWTLSRPTVLKQALDMVNDDLPLDEIAQILALRKGHLETILQPITGNRIL
ncbi:MAG: ImmA/IrrE family metallo-endopeptidase [Candidatus Competibacteraceae bacterium]|nr:ImmA/IrrE family metallo-endopeptidase [Candidatus Competibacteraceae bacterium]MCB1813323.1 ImmA/IrrE family metallo-endopeptidase [Candidatus Competibacteraceae bacterium]